VCAGPILALLEGLDEDHADQQQPHGQEPRAGDGLVGHAHRAPPIEEHRCDLLAGDGEAHHGGSAYVRDGRGQRGHVRDPSKRGYCPIAASARAAGMCCSSFHRSRAIPVCSLEPKVAVINAKANPAPVNSVP
jgi:hypothetical protein